ncbi:sugar phosphate isomerase/epimerase [Oceanobacillus arenosus]|uniref:Sugar phosphate isomerase/epimerase n=1 Tax=Oceanobacillus arenosus TaxID=1229153 RepID=A0A3D8Q237_9BACI|nr:sugar phosphate isomerase/epimerase [Oceanobacillus arenosus]RDW21469.1 sugar phosphate isomerase/epimerase [Oceanobacillus arenosus]
MENVGLQFWSIKDAAEQDLLQLIRKVAEMGYTGAQFAGFGNYSAEEVKETMAEAGIKAAGAHVQLELLENQLDETLKYHETIGNDLLIVPYLQENRRTTVDDYKRTAELLNGIGQKVRAAGFSLGYHNHDFEFERFDSKTGFDILYENTDANYLKMELDCFWASYAGHDPIAVIEKYADRCVSLHIKDMKIVDAQPISTELGTGTLPLATYMKKGNEVGVKWFIVEQEHFTKDPLESAAENVKAIRNIGKR